MELLALPQLLKFMAALVFVLALMLLLALAMKRINNGTGSMTGGKRRLRIVEIMPLDARRKLALLRRDGVEHLVILGTNSETVIETGIETPQDTAIPSS